MNTRKERESNLQSTANASAQYQSEIAKPRITHQNAFCAEALTVEAGSLREKVSRVVEKAIQEKQGARDWIEMGGVAIGGVVAFQNLINTKPDDKVAYAVASILVAIYFLTFVGLIVWKNQKYRRRKVLKLIDVEEMISEIREDSAKLGGSPKQ